jgi:hypothetical protein
MLVPNRPGRAPNPPSGEDDLERWAAEANDSFSDLARWAQQIHSAIFDSYIPQTDRIENMIMVGTGTSERPDPIGSRRFYYDLATRVLYLDVRDGGTEAWEIVFSSDGEIVVLDTSNFGKVLGATDANLQDAMDTIDDHIHAAEEITVDVSGFGNILGALDDEVQHALDTLDDLAHSDLPDAGTYDHEDIDNHIDDGTIHFVEGDISHLNIQDIGAYDHADIDSHLYDLDFFHDHGNLTGLDGDDHPAYLLASDATDRATFAANWTDLTDSGETTLHIHDTRYYTEGEVDTLLTGYLPLTAGSGTPVAGDLYAQQLIVVGSLAGNGILIDPVNGVYLYGSAIAWDDLRFPALDTKLGGSKDPTFAVFKTNGAGSQGVFTYWFDKTTEQELYFLAQLPHRWAQGTDLEVHCHWVPKSTAVGAGTDVCWGLEYTWANINGTFGDTAIIYGDEQTNGATETLTVGKHYITEVGTISGTGKTLSSMLVCRVFRDAGGTGGTDDYDDDAGLLEIDFHFQVDSFGSDDEYTKGP